MYSQFCKNLKYFIDINSNFDNKENIRLEIAKSILPIADIEQYKKNKETNYQKYLQTNNQIYLISQYTEEFPSLKKFIWELWGYGFDIYNTDKNANCKTEYPAYETAKIIDLLLSTHYFHSS